MARYITFPTLADALRAGFSPYEDTSTGYMVRSHTYRGWAIAMVPHSPHQA